MEALDLVIRPIRHDRHSGTKSFSELESKNPSQTSFLPQEQSVSPIPSLHSFSSVIIVSDDSSASQSMGYKLPTVESLSSECTTSDLNFSSSECISSDDREVIYVPIISSTCKKLSNGHLLTEGRKHGENKYSQHKECEHGDPPKYGYMCSFHNSEDTVDSEELSSRAVLLDSESEMDTLESIIVSSTSDAETVNLFKPAHNATSTLNLLLPKNAQKRAPTSKKQKKTNQGRKVATRAARGRRKKARPTGSSFPVFARQEPEIKLKCTGYKEVKRESRGNSFAPYIRMKSSTCTIVNFNDDNDDSAQMRKNQQCAAPVGIVPTTSCLQLGRLKLEGRCQTSELCCLCHHTANAVGLGDLHGPYHPCDRTATGNSASSLSFTLNLGVLSDCNNSAKRKYSSKIDGGERWVHEDCSIWSAGVFLVKGKLYGLMEALRFAQKVVCSCCQRTGATLGCFFKGCPNKYHFPCALQAECMLNEENFTIKCPKHKYKVSITTLQNR